MSDKTVILGISSHYHDAAAALVVDGELIAACHEERFTRQKHDPNFPVHAIEFCLTQAGLGRGDITHVGFYDKPFLKFERLLNSYLAHWPWGFRAFAARDAAVDEEQAVDPQTDPKGTRFRRAGALQRAPHEPRGLGVSGLALHRGGHPHARWRGGVGRRPPRGWVGAIALRSPARSAFPTRSACSTRR